MSCYHPFLGVKTDEYNPETKKFAYKILGRYDPLAKSSDPSSIAVPCGKCLGCRLDYSRRWADRMMLEFDHSKKAMFVTLTYNNEHVPVSEFDELGIPKYFTLYKKDYQDFMKRLRSRKEFENKEIRFYASGEYGSKTFRPHYHAILFGIDIDDFKDKRQIGQNAIKQPYYSSEFLEKIWSKGFVMMTPVSWQTCAYVSRYVMKKANADYSYMYDLMNCDPEFSLMSRRPGIGSYFLEDHPDAFEYCKYFVDGNEIQIPKYFLRKLELTDPDRYAKIIEERKKYVDDREFLKLQNTDLNYIQQLEVDENHKINSIKALSRNLA